MSEEILLLKVSPGSLALGGNVQEHLISTGLSGVLVLSVFPERDELEVTRPKGTTKAQLEAALNKYTGVPPSNPRKAKIDAAKAKANAGDMAGALSDVLKILES